MIRQSLLPIESPVVVVDCETTGFRNTDRILEVATVTLDPVTGEVVDEFDTLINPERDPGPTAVHGITSSMVEAAPTFAEVIAALSRRLNNAVMAAHNLSFDSRMLRNEFQRKGINLNVGNGICTYRLSGEKLNAACARFDIHLGQQHRALGDARATAELLKVFADDVGPGFGPVQIGHVPFPLSTRTLRRERLDVGGNETVRVVSHTRYPYSDEAILHYLDVLDWVLDDHVIDDEERIGLRDLAQSYGLSEGTVADVHRAYLASIIAAARRDGMITEAERALIQRTRSALMIEDVDVPTVTSVPSTGLLQDGMRVCFTGVVIAQGREYPRSTLESLAAQAGLQPTRSVTKRGCDLLVAADTSSMSGKSRKARQYGIAVMAGEDFIIELGVTDDNPS